MQFVKGMIVRSKKGHDKGRFFVVTDVNEHFVFVSDAASRPLSGPKKKNPLHLAPTKTVLSAEQMRSDSEIINTLAAFRGRVDLPKEVI